MPARIAYVTTAAHGYTMAWHLEDWGKNLPVVQRSYAQLLQPGPQPLFEAYIFADLERLSEVQLHSLQGVWTQLAQLPDPPRLLNHPGRVHKRLPLLQKLHQLGRNHFNAHPIVTGQVPTPARFPVFIREANEHQGPISDLLHSPEELAAEIARLRAYRELPPHPIVVEWVDTREADGLYRKYSVFRVGDHLIGSHLHEGPHWMVKLATATFADDFYAREYAFVCHNPHAAALLETFELAGIDFGRIDYGLHQGKIQVFEINTNPALLYPRVEGDRRIPCDAVVNEGLERAFLELL